MVSKFRYAVPGFTKGKWFCDLKKESGLRVRCKMVFKGYGSSGEHLWEGEPDCSKCQVVKEAEAE